MGFAVEPVLSVVCLSLNQLKRSALRPYNAKMEQAAHTRNLSRICFLTGIGCLCCGIHLLQVPSVVMQERRSV